MVSWWALRKLRKETEYLPSSNHQTADTPSSGLGCKNTGYWPQKAEGYQRNDFSELRLLHLPKHRKALNSLRWDFWFSLRLIFWCFHYLPIVAKLLYILAPRSPLPSWSSPSRVTWDAAFWAWSPKKSRWMKQNSQLWGCEYFLSRRHKWFFSLLGFFSPYMYGFACVFLEAKRPANKDFIFIHIFIHLIPPIPTSRRGPRTLPEETSSHLLARVCSLNTRRLSLLWTSHHLGLCLDVSFH